MSRRGYLKAAMGVLLLFAIGLVGYFALSAGSPDGLERVMEDNGVEEGDQLWSAPLDYGGDWGTAFVAGLIGFALTFGAVYLYLKVYLKGGSARRKA
ncbi:MAG TPA: hypothetical protein P5189_06285 [Methanomassiliicoccales archaeon]|nr:hypothetical protein [Methanomassiliicoccales archaeon]